MYEPRTREGVAGDRPVRTDGGSESLSLDDAFSVLADRRRRYVLYELCGEEFLPLEELAERVAAREAERPSDQLSEERIGRVSVDLHHQILPKLHERRLVDYDARVGQVTADARFPLIEKYLDLAREDEAALH